MPRPVIPLHRWFLLASLGVIGLATLTPGTHIPPCSPWAFFCDQFRGADTVGNILLFVPFGVALGAGGAGRWRYVLPLGIGATIELLQATSWIHRDPSLRDALTNGLGGAIGVWIGAHWPHVARPTERRRWFWGWVLVLTAAFLTGAAILQPSFPDSLWYGQWTAELGQFDRFSGTVETARLGALEVGSGPLAQTAALRREAVRTGYSLAVRVRASGGPSARFAPALSLFDHSERQLAVIGRWRDDLAYTARIAGQDHGYYPIWFRVPGAFHRVPAELTIEGRVQSGSFSGGWQADSAEHGARRETIGPIDEWRTIVPDEWVIALPARAISALLLAGLMLPLGYLGTSSGRLERRSFGTIIPASIALIPMPLGLSVAPPLHWATAGAGFVIGVLVAWVRRDSPATTARSR